MLPARRLRSSRGTTLVAVAVAALLTLGACGSSAGTTDPEVLSSSTHAVGAASWGVVAEEQIWVTDPAAGAVVELDERGAVVREVSTGAPDPRDAGMALDGDRLWVANLGGTVGVVDTRSGEALARVEVGPGEPAAVAVDGGSAWVPLHGPDGGLAQVDAETFEVLRRVELPESAFDVAAADGAVWVAGLDRRVFEIDAASGDVRRSIDVGAAPRGIALTEDSAWITLRDDREVVRVDRTRGDVVARIPLDGQPWPIAADDRSVWVVDLAGVVTRIDARTNDVIGTAASDEQPRGVTVGRGAVWVAGQTGRVTRIEMR